MHQNMYVYKTTSACKYIMWYLTLCLIVGERCWNVRGETELLVVGGIMSGGTELRPNTARFAVMTCPGEGCVNTQTIKCLSPFTCMLRAAHKQKCIPYI